MKWIHASLVVCGALLLSVGPASAQTWSKLKGRVTLEGPISQVKSFEDAIRNHALGKHYLKCAKEYLLDPTWKVDTKTRAVANVVVYLQPSKAGYSLPIHADDKKRSDKVLLDTPACAYVPHITALYPEWRVGNDKGKTGQQFFVSCSMKDVPGFFFRLNVDPLLNRHVSLMMASGQKTELFLNPQRAPIDVQDFFRPWMKAYIWVFDHPYFAITQDDGSFEIPRIPAAADMKLIAWHEACGRFYSKALELPAKESFVSITLTAAP